MAEGDVSRAGRLPLPDPHDLSSEQNDAITAIMSGPRGEIVGPFIPLLRSPELMTRIQLVGEFVRFDSLLDDHLVELVVLCVARYWNQDFEWGFHRPIAEAKGLPASVIDDIGAGRGPIDSSDDIYAVWSIVHELLHTRQVSDETFTRATAALGEVKVVEAIATAGYYALLAMILNTARTPAPAGAPPLPRLLGDQVP